MSEIDIRNKSIPSLSVIISHLDFLYQILNESSSLHYQKEITFALKSIMDELKKSLLSKHYSQNYVAEKCNTIISLSQEIGDDDKIDESTNNNKFKKEQDGNISWWKE